MALNKNSYSVRLFKQSKKYSRKHRLCFRYLQGYFVILIWNLVVQRLKKTIAQAEKQSSIRISLSY